MARKIADVSEIYDAKPDREYFTIVPNMILDMDLNSYDVRLYCELKRVAGEKGKCWMTTETLAQRCGMSTGMISNCKKKLEARDLIVIKEVPNNVGVIHIIEIVDIWERNSKYCKKEFEQIPLGSPHEPDAPGSPHEPAGSCGEVIKITVNKNPIHSTGQENFSSLAKNGDQMNKEDYLKSVEESLMKGMTSHTIGYAHFPERLVPVVQRMETLWHFKVPEGRGKNYSFWIKSCDEVLSASAEFGVAILDKLYEDWKGYQDSHQGFAPFTVSGPQSLVKSVLAKAAMLRGGNKASLWGTNGKPDHKSTLDV